MTDIGDSSSSLGPLRRATGRDVRFLVIARILGPVGVNGDVRAQMLTDFPEHFSQLSEVNVGDNLRPYRIVSAKPEGTTVVLKLAGVDDAEAGRALRNHELHIPIDQAMRLPTDQYYWHQVVGLKVRTDEGRELGEVTDVLRTGSNDVYVVGRGSNELLIPAIEDVILTIDPDRGLMIVHLIPGLVDEA